MPRVVDHQERRRHIAEALWRVTVAHGLEGVTLRHVAAEAHVSMGLVQHYFASKDEMLLFSLDSLHEQVTHRMARNVASASHPLGPRALLRAVLVEMLPLDERRRTEAQVGLAFMARAVVHPVVAAALRTKFDQLQQFVADQITRAWQGEDRNQMPQPEATAAELLALLDGLTAHLLAGCRTLDTAIEVFDQRLNAALPAIDTQKI